MRRKMSCCSSPSSLFRTNGYRVSISISGLWGSSSSDRPARMPLYCTSAANKITIIYRFTWCCRTRWDAFVYSVILQSLSVWLSALCHGTTRVRSTCLSRTRSDSRKRVFKRISGEMVCFMNGARDSLALPWCLMHVRAPVRLLAVSS